jgi:cyclohexa-1,5-dienecarbonyl-CoA hydratase
MTTGYESCRLEFAPPVARLVLDRPPLNVLDLECVEELESALGEVASRADVSLLVIAAEGERAFSAGVEVRDHLPDRLEDMLETFHRFCRRLLELDAVTVAAVSGPALGGAMELLACCDFVVASRTSVFGQPEIDLACFPPLAAALYPALFGKARASSIVLLGEPMSAEEAKALGLVHDVVARDELESAVQALVEKLSKKSPAALRLAKKALRSSTDRALERLPEIETLYREELAATADMLEGLEAFLEKRKPSWKGE